MSKQRTSWLADAGLMLTAIIWGAGFSATQYALDAGLSSAMILTLRFALAAAALALVCGKSIRTLTLPDWKNGWSSGLFLFLGFLFQVEGQGHTTPSNCAFITTTNVLMVPFLLWAVTRKRPALKNLLLPLLTVAGIFLLGYVPGTGIAFTAGDLLALLCAFFFACHIASLEFTSRRVEAVKLTFIQMAVAAVLSLGYALVTKQGTLAADALRGGALPVLYLGLLSTCLCFFLQTAAQKHTSATKAAIFLSMEGVFGSLFSVALGLEPVRWTLLVGGGIIFLSVVLTEVEFGRKNKGKCLEDTRGEAQ